MTEVAKIRSVGAVRAGDARGGWWAEFADRHWEQTPATVPAAHGVAQDDADILLSALTTAAIAHGRDGSLSDLVIWADGAKLPEPWRRLPLDATSLQGLLIAVDEWLGAKSFTLLLANPHLYDARLWRKAREVLRQGQAHIGLTNGGVDTCAFMGRYRQTPFGVHRGQMSVMTFPVLGRKRFLLWPFRYGDTHTDLHDSLSYARHLGAASEAVGGPGDILYWPADYWHIADGDGGYSAAWNIGFWFDRPPIQRVFERLSDILADGLGRGQAECVSLPAQAEPPAPLRATLDALAQSAAGSALRRAVAEEWLAFVSGDGFRAPPPLLESPVSAWAHGARRVSEQILWSRLEGDLVVAAAGHLHTVRAADDTEALLAALQAGETVRSNGQDSAAPLLRFLYACGALAEATP